MNIQKLKYLDLEINNHRKVKLNLTERIQVSCNIFRIINLTIFLILVVNKLYSRFIN